MILRDYQKEAIRRVYEQLRINQSVMLMLPTGAGKSCLSQAIIEHGLKHSKRINFLTDRLVLSDQILDRFIEAKIPTGVVQASHPMTNRNHPVQVCSVQTLARKHPSQWPPADLFIVDEAHISSGVVTTMKKRWDLTKWIGLSATPFTRGLGREWDSLVVGATTRQLMDEGYLCPYIAYGPSTPDLAGVKVSKGDWVASGLAERMSVLTGNIVSHYQRLAAGKKAVVFTPTVAYAERLSEEFRKGGVSADFVCGRDTDERRREIMLRYKRGEIQVICNCDVLSRGWDEPDVEVGILARPTKSLSLHTQQVGRILRTSPGKERAILIDHAGNIERHGFPDDDLPDTMCMEEKGVSTKDSRPPEEPKPWNCPQCFVVVPPKTVPCPSCGFKPKGKSKVEIREGVLKELKKAGAPTNDFNLRCLALPESERHNYKQQIYSQLLQLCRDKGFVQGWVANQYRAIFGVWPKGLFQIMLPFKPDLAEFVKEQARKYAASKAIKKAYGERKRQGGYA
jgi:superfamily II DNA or RNA helicase